MRVYATDTVMKLLDRLGFKEGEALEHRMISNSIVKAQKRVEENNFGIRKHLIDYDDVMNKQRTFIYHRRNHALRGERIGIDISNTVYDVIDNLVRNYSEPAAFDDLKLELVRIAGIEPDFTAADYDSLSLEERTDRLHALAMSKLDRLSEAMKTIMLPILKEHVEAGESGIRAIPVTDGKRLFRIEFDMEEAVRTEGRSMVKEWQKRLILLTIDEFWKEHLRENDDLRQSVRNASYEQKDPLVIYKHESFHMFQRMLGNLNERTVQSLMRGRLYIRPREEQPAQQANGEQPAAQQQPQQNVEMSRSMPRQRTDAEYKTSKATLPSEEEAQRRAASAPAALKARHSL